MRTRLSNKGEGESERFTVIIVEIDGTKFDFTLRQGSNVAKMGTNSFSVADVAALKVGEEVTVKWVNGKTVKAKIVEVSHGIRTSVHAGNSKGKKGAIAWKMRRLRRPKRSGKISIDTKPKQGGSKPTDHPGGGR